MSVTPSRAITELRRIFREYDEGRLSEDDYRKQADALQLMVERAHAEGKISYATYDRFDRVYVTNMYYVNDV